MIKEIMNPRKQYLSGLWYTAHTVNIFTNYIPHTMEAERTEIYRLLSMLPKADEIDDSMYSVLLKSNTFDNEKYTGIDTYAVEFTTKASYICGLIEYILKVSNDSVVPSIATIKKETFYRLKGEFYLKLKKFFDINEVFIFDGTTLADDVSQRTYADWRVDIGGCLLLLAMSIEKFTEPGMKNHDVIIKRYKTVIRLICNMALSRLKEHVRTEKVDAKSVLKDICSIPQFKTLSEARIAEIQAIRTKRDDRTGDLRVVTKRVYTRKRALPVKSDEIEIAVPGGKKEIKSHPVIPQYETYLFYGIQLNYEWIKYLKDNKLSKYKGEKLITETGVGYKYGDIDLTYFWSTPVEMFMKVLTDDGTTGITKEELFNIEIAKADAIAEMMILEQFQTK